MIQAISSYDQFTAKSTLRLKYKSSSMNFYLGVISFLLLIVFTLLLFTRLDKTIKNHESQIKFTQSQKRMNEGDNFDDFMFSIGLDSWIIPNMTDYQNYFTIYVEYLSKNESGMKLEILKPCTPDKWKKLGPDYLTLYYKYLLNETFCPENPINISVVDITQDFLKIHLSDCLKNNNSNCKSQKQIQQNIFGKIRINNKTSFNIYLNLLVQSVEINSQIPINYNIRQEKIKFDLNYDVSGYSFLSIKKNIKMDLEKYHIEFDNTPFSFLNEFYQDNQIVQGYVIGQFMTKIQFFLRCQYPKQYLLLSFAHSQKLKNYKRSTNKIDEIMSEVQGLKDIIVGIIALFLGSFNQIRYQITVAGSSFNYNSDGKKIKRKDLNLWTYTKYYFYDLIKIICYFEPRWTQTQQMVKTVKESNEILDAKKFFRKLDYLEKVVEENLSENTINSMPIMAPLSLKQIQEKRLLISYYETIINCEEAATVQDALAQSSKSFNYLKKSESLLSSSLSRLNPEINQEKPDQVQQKEKQMEQSFAKHLRLDLETCRSISKYPLIAEDAQKIELTEEETEMEIKMTTRFLSLSSAKKREVIKKVPIIILHRLRMRAQSLQQQTFGESKLKIKDEKKITLKDLVKNTRSIFSQFDTFTAQPSLGTNVDQLKKSFHLLDIANIAILIFLGYTFAIQLDKIASTDSSKIKFVSYNKVEKNLYEIPNLMFAIKLQEDFTQQFGGPLGLMSNMQWNIEYQPVENITITQKMVPCQPEMWASLGKKSYRQFVNYELDKAYCVKKNIKQIKPIQNKAFLKLTVSACPTNNFYEPYPSPSTYNNITKICQNKALQNFTFCKTQILTPYYNKTIDKYRYFPIRIYNLVPQFSPDNKEPITYNIKMSRFSLAKNKYGIFNQFFNPKRIITDSSIWPYNQQIVTVDEYEISSVDLDRFNSLYTGNSSIFILNFYARSNIIVYDRKVQKIDTVLSDRANIFGILVGVIAFVFGSYYQNRFGLHVCESSFNFDSDGKKYSEKQLSSLKQIKFNFLNVLPFSLSQNSQKQMKLMNKTLDEVNDILDIQKILKRIDLLERVIWKFEDLNYLSAISLIQHRSISQISHNRMILEYYDQIVQQKEAASVEDAVKKDLKSFNYLKSDSQLSQEIFEQSQVIKQATRKQLKMKQIELSLINDLKISNDIAKAISQYPEICEQAQKIQLSPEWDQIETQIAYGFLNLSQRKKEKIMMKIPIIIIHRLRMKEKKFQKYSKLVLKKKDNEKIENEFIPEFKNESQTQMMIVRKTK